jgi:hypothetical protein
MLLAALWIWVVRRVDVRIRGGFAEIFKERGYEKNDYCHVASVVRADGQRFRRQRFR